MPPKYKPGGKKFPPKVVQSSLPPQASSSSSSNGLDTEAEDQFETELCWCIQSLQTALDSGKLTERQILDTNKTIHVLKSNTAPLIKKRQFMRTTFGDYRSKMNDDAKKLGKITGQVKFNDKSTSSKTTGNKKSMFIKKANPTKGDIETTENSFTFNFKSPEDKTSS